MGNTMVIIWLMMVNSNDWLVVEPPTPLKNGSSSVGMMTFPINMEKYKSHVPVTTTQNTLMLYSCTGEHISIHKYHDGMHVFNNM